MTRARWTRLLAAEGRLFAAGRSNLLLLLALAALAVFSVWGGVDRALETRAVQAEAAKADAESWRAKRGRFLDLQAGRLEVSVFSNPERADLVVMGHRTPLALAPLPLAPLSAGSVREGHDIVEAGMTSRYGRGAETTENPVNRLDGPLDLAFVVAWILPLLLLVLSYEGLARDREQQVAPLLASGATPLRRIVLARSAVRFGSAFLIVGGVATGAVALSVGPGGFPGAAPDLLLWLAGLAAYIAFWLAVAAWVNARARSATRAGLTLLGVWILVSLVTPVATALWVSSTTPPPDRLAYVLQLRAMQNDFAERADEVREAYYAENPARRPVRPAFSEYEAYFVETYYPRQRMLDRAFAPIARALHALQVAQAERLRIASVLSPPLAMKRLTDDLAGHAPERRLAFFDAIGDFETRIRNAFDIKLASRRPLTQADYDAVPTYSPAPEPALARARLASTLLIALFAAAALCALGAWTRLRKAGP